MTSEQTAELVLQMFRVPIMQPRYRITKAAKRAWWLRAFAPTSMIDKMLLKVQPVETS